MTAHYVDWLEYEGDSFVFEVERGEIALARDGAGRTFSAAALETLGAQMLAFVASRVVREWGDGPAPDRLTVGVSVKLGR
jgi:hypothetical protein